MDLIWDTYETKIRGGYICTGYCADTNEGNCTYWDIHPVTRTKYELRKVYIRENGQVRIRRLDTFGKPHKAIECLHEYLSTQVRGDNPPKDISKSAAEVGEMCKNGPPLGARDEYFFR